MATFIIGLFIGGYSGAVLREELSYPTSEKIERAFEVFKANEKIVNSNSRAVRRTTRSSSPSPVQPSGNSSN